MEIDPRFPWKPHPIFHGNRTSISMEIYLVLLKGEGERRLFRVWK